ncbi:MAG TPA: GNAT family N-acetyltransferase [Mycobacterium sp.]|uniref:N-acetylglutamate synthase, CG3035 family n=1 Tax=Mycobacterium sp. TaxID=1785 RepID=UPI002C3B35B4|nr:GNAT family N-acetyltransferase [Mycobacterium sp.]HME78121.1 GNAT family N-acetyltransferase [Mycobacterium sp.]
MVSWPPPGTRVTVRYRRPAGSVPPLTDAVGHLLDIEPVVRVQTKTGTVVQFAPADAIAVRVLSDAPVRTSQIRALEHAAALAWPGVEQHWLDGWLLRAGRGVTLRANSAVPLDISSSSAAIPAIVDWYTRRGLIPRLAIADRLLRMPGVGEQANAVLVRDVSSAAPDPSVRISGRPDDAWLRLYRREVPIDVLTAVVDGELAFGMHAELAVARASVTEAPDGTRWVGLSELRVADQGAGLALCEALLAWGAARGATRGYVRVLDDDHAAAGLAHSVGFALHHTARYFAATT